MNEIATIVYVLASAAMYDGYHLADGSCLADKDYPELAKVLHDGENWPYGRCDRYHFRLPDLTAKVNNEMREFVAIIKVK